MAAKKRGLIFRDILGEGEFVLWSGHPQQGIIIRVRDIYMIPFSLLWGGFACFWTVAATAAAGLFGVFGLPFVLMGLYITVGRFFVEAHQRRHTHYALTNDRVIIVSGMVFPKITSLTLSTLTAITLDQKRSGRGTITFGPEYPVSWLGWKRTWPGTGPYNPPMFELIPDARWVYDQIRQAQHESLAWTQTLTGEDGRYR